MMDEEDQNRVAGPVSLYIYGHRSEFHPRNDTLTVSFDWLAVDAPWKGTLSSATVIFSSVHFVLRLTFVFPVYYLFLYYTVSSFSRRASKDWSVALRRSERSERMAASESIRVETERYGALITSPVAGLRRRNTSFRDASFDPVTSPLPSVCRSAVAHTRSY